MLDFEEKEIREFLCKGDMVGHVLRCILFKARQSSILIFLQQQLTANCKCRRLQLEFSISLLEAEADQGVGGICKVASRWNPSCSQSK